MKLSDLIKDTDLGMVQGEDREITGIEINSKKVKPGNLFIAYKGFNIDSHKYIKDAIDRGAVAVCVEELPKDLPDKVTILKTNNARSLFSVLGSNFYGHPADELKIIGLTGTKGKTTTAAMIASILEEAGHKVGTIGTLGARYDDKTVSTANTTPNSLELNRIFRDMIDSGVEYVVMEASSQGFKLDRTEGLSFLAGILLNISPDHIGENEHESFEEYLNCKLKITGQSKNLFVNRPDEIWGYVPKGQQDRAITFGLDDPESDYYSLEYETVVDENGLGTSFKAQGKLDETFNLELPGRFNNVNALAAIAVCNELGINKEDIKEGLKKVRVDGRTELLKEARKKGRTVFLDFAHNHLSVAKLLESLRDYKPVRLVNLFGLEYDETKARRYEMGFASGKGADLSILTTGTLGDESFESVNAEVVRGLEESGGKYIVIPDRKEAIKKALEETNEEDILVIMNLATADHGKSLPEIEFLNETIDEINEIRSKNS